MRNSVDQVCQPVCNTMQAKKRHLGSTVMENKQNITPPTCKRNNVKTDWLAHICRLPLPTPALRELKSSHTTRGITNYPLFKLSACTLALYMSLDQPSP
mmetsp:Transcript_60840/g.96549  ORF Transcript_60840/g.96549 Transcript_60840/m.96549 type:complete len:99 (+) Transcript_60840:3-299(+)